MCFIRKSDGTEDPLVKDVLTYIEALSVKIGAVVESRFSLILKQLDEIKANEIAKEKNVPRAYKRVSFHKKAKTQRQISPKFYTHRIDKFKQRLLCHIRRVPVISFNSGRYDLNLVKRDFHSFYTENDKNEIKTIKRCNQYIA